MTIAVQEQGTTGPGARTGPLTVPMQIISVAGARHRVAVTRYRALPAWALLATVALAGLVLAVALTRWHETASLLEIGMTFTGLGCAFALEALAMLTPQVES